MQEERRENKGRTIRTRTINQRPKKDSLFKEQKNNTKTIKKGVLTALLLFACLSISIYSSEIYKGRKETTRSDVATIEAEEKITEVTGILSNGEGYIEGDSIVQVVRRLELPDGNYTLRIKGKTSSGTEETKDYRIELINHYEDVTYSLGEGQTSRTVSLGDTTKEYKMLVVKYHKNLTVDKGVTLTATNVSSLTYKKGMYLCVMGELKNSGTISMTARGTYNQAGENVYLWKNINDTYEYVPAVGGTGGAAVTATRSSNGGTYYNGKNGNIGINRALGGGGSGGAGTWRNSRGTVNGRAGATATSYSGGSGSGGIRYDVSNTTTYNGYAAAANGGAGGRGAGIQGNSSPNIYGGGGAGNTGGAGYYSSRSSNSMAWSAGNGQNGTGGLLTIYADTLSNKGTITSNGSAGGPVTANTSLAGAGGGGSGAGSINIFSRVLINHKAASAQGGIGGKMVMSGGNGGNGSITITQLAPDLNYSDKEISINCGEEYLINNSKLQYINQNGIQTPNISIGNISYEILDNSVAEVNSDGRIIGLSEGKTKIKITDITNDLSTYIFLNVVNNVKVDVQEGKNFTVALKQNGTVWSYGLNTNGQLGIGNNDNKLEPTQIDILRNIKSIATGYFHSLALTKSGEVYSWGLGTSGQLGNGLEENSNVPVKVEGISNVVKIDAYKNISVALDKEGRVYIWGEGYSTLPMRVIFSQTVVDISGILMLTERGEVYKITDTANKISGLSNIAKISCGEAHYLALDVNGTVYSWGTNTYGECGTATTGSRGVAEIGYDIYEISAGNCTSILQGEEEKIYVLGNNASGQIGLSTTAKATALTRINVSDNVKIENISAGEGTHSGIIDVNGFVWHTGVNTYGELGIGNNTTQKVFVKTGDTVLNINQEDKIYLDLEETITINSRLENTFNLKVDLIDDNQENFEISLSNTDKLKLEDKTLTAKEYGATTVTITHISTGKTKELQVSAIMKMESIVQGMRDAELADGEYEILIQDQVYTIELCNYYEDVRYSLGEGETNKTISLGDNSTEYKMLVAKYHKNLTIDSGVTLTATNVSNLTYKKGMYICVLGELKNNGIISMTARGTYNAEGENVYLWKNIDDSYEYIPAIGAKGGESVTATRSSNGGTYYNGKNGKAGVNRALGGGGSGAAGTWRQSKGTTVSRAGETATSYSGGSGSGGIRYDVNTTTTYYGTSAGTNGGPGGKGIGIQGNTAPNIYGGGGAGNTAGIGTYSSSRNNSYNWTTGNGQNGTGGLLTIYADILDNTNTISSDGSKGGPITKQTSLSGTGGGGSGGGSINIFARIISNVGTNSVKGGAGGLLSSQGGAGGNGSVTINELGSVLNYSKKNIEININDIYEIDASKVSYTKLNDIQTEDLILGELEYESLDSSIAEVDSNGKITAVSLGKTKVKITDLANGYSTYIIVEVTKEGLVTPQVKEGIDFTVALKANGTVWSYGLNSNGQLGNNSEVNANEPVQVITEEIKPLENIVDIGAGTASGIALSKSGEVYTWGKYSYIEYIEKEDIAGNITVEEKAHTENILTARKEERLENIVEVDAYKNRFYAVDENGNVYVWGEGYSEPTKIETDKLILKVEGNILLGQDGLVYSVENPSKAIEYLSNICEVSCGEDHYIFVTLDGYVYSLGKGALGQLGNGKYADVTSPALIKTENGYLAEASEISAGNKISMAVTYDGKAYVWGDNTNKKLGITETKTAYAKEITKLQEKNGTEIDLRKIELVEAGTNHTTIVDEKGFVYTVGLNTLGQLGTEDNKNRDKYTRIGNVEIITHPEELKVGVGASKDISIVLSNSFNLKGDIAEDGELNITNTNEKEITIEKYEEVDNSKVTNIEEFTPNYKITGNKIGRVNVNAINENGYTKNIWINVVESEDAKASAKVVNGEGYTIVLRSDGTVWSYGKNTNGQLGLGDTNNRNEPEKIETVEEIIDITTGQNHTILLGKSGKVYSFGVNGKGQLGTGNTTTYKNPIVLKIENIEKVIAKENTSFAINKDGKVYAWGNGYTKTPAMLNIDTNVIDISKNYYLSVDGKVRKLVDNTIISLSLNEYDPAGEPELEEEKIVQMSEGIDHLIMLGESGRIYTYGENVYGQLGDGTTNRRENNISTVVRLEDENILENIVEISAGNKYGIAVDKDKKVYTFGINGNKQLGFDSVLEEGGIQESRYAILKEDIMSVERVTAGYTHTSVYKEDGNVYAWGEGEEGQLGNGENSEYYESQKVGKEIIETNTNEIVIEEEEIYDIDGNIEYFNLFEEKEPKITYEMLDESLGILDAENGRVIGLKAGRTTILAKEEGTENIGVVQLRILEKGTKPEEIEVVIEPQVETSGNHTIMLKVDGTVWSYGIGKYGELGNGKEGASDEVVQAIFPKGTVITKIAAGENHSLALDSNGNVWVWGRNNYGQLGNSNSNNILVPTKVSGLSKIKDIAAGIYTSYAIGEIGEVYSFGLNANGECGIGSYTNKITTPTKAKYIRDVIDIKAGKNHTMILKSTGEVYVTGSNLYGELGINTTERKTKIFKKVDGLNKVVSIATGDSNNTVVTADGSIYSWGSNKYKELGIESDSAVIQEPTKVIGLDDIRYIEGGKGYQIAVNSNNEVFVNGINTSGELGNNTKEDIHGYTKLETIKDVMQVSAGNKYTTMLKTDGTVWACGDYTHGDENIKSKTKSNVPIQVGNDQTGLGQTQITINVENTKEITTNCAYELNLIKLADNFIDSLTFESLNEEIAQINAEGVVTGKRVGTTRVNAISNIDGRKYSVLVNVIPQGNIYAPEVEAGENFVATLKGDGNIWTFGYNSDGRLAIGNNITKDLPIKTNIISTYEDIKVGKDYIIALRSDGTVWSVGNNKKGQLGNGTTEQKNKFAQIEGLEGIEKIEAGEDFAMAIDNHGIVYGWGNGVLKPTIIENASQRIVDLGAGKDQRVYVTAKGTVYGYGNILNGTIEGIENAIEVQVTKDRIVILTSENEVYSYQNGNLTKIEVPGKVIDISGTNTSVMYQTVDEKTYVTGENTYGELGVGTQDSVETPTLINVHGENTYTIGAGYTNTYLIENTGNIYASGNNEYGSLGNGTRESTKEHTLVGKRIFEVNPKAATMSVGDEEEITVIGEPFNVFGLKEIPSDEYQWETDENEVITLEPGKITAISEGTAHITITDKITKESASVTRVVIAPENDRINKIIVNSDKAALDISSTDESMKYTVKVITDENKGNLELVTKDSTDRISIDGGATWSYNGTLNQEIELLEKTTEIPIIVGVKNNTGEYPVEMTYTLTVEKISDDIGIKEITVTSKDKEEKEETIKAKAVGLKRYEVAIGERTEISLAKVVANSEYSYISIDGQEYTEKEQTKEIELGNELTKEITIVLKTEAGTEVEYTLVIYKENEAMNLSSLKVNDIEATKTSEGKYAINVSSDTKIGNIVATTESDIVSVRIADNEYSIKTTTKEIQIDNYITEVKVSVKLDENIKEYILSIYKMKEIELLPEAGSNPEAQSVPRINMLLINGTVVKSESNGLTYIEYLPSAETEATIRVIAKEETVTVKIADNEEEIGESERVVSTINNENTYKVVLTDTEETSVEYTVILRKAGTDTSLDEIYVSNGDTDINAVLQEDKNYTVKVPNAYTNVDVTAITGYARAKVQVAETGNYVVNRDTQNVILEAEETEVKIKVQSEDGTNEEEYILKIVKKSANTNLAKVEVDGEEVTIGENGNYHYTLLEAKNNVTVNAIAESETAYVKIEDTQYNIYESSKQIDIVSKNNIVSIKVKSEDGIVKEYNLIIESLPDDTNIKEVTVNGEEATYVEGENRYEVRSQETEYEIEVTLNDPLASMILGNNAEAIGTDSITIEKTGAETEVKVIVKSQNGLEQQEYTIVILEKSSNNNLDTIKVNGELVNIDSEGNYKTTVKNATNKIEIEAIAEDSYAKTKVNNIGTNNYIATYTENIVEGKTIYSYVIEIVSENGSKQEYSLEVEQLEANTNITNILVGKDELTLEEATVQEDGSYYYKIDRVEEAYITVNLESEKSNVIINELEETTTKVKLEEEINSIVIKVIGEDGTEKEYTLVIEKKSNDVGIESIVGEGLISTDIQEGMAYIYVDEDLTEVDVTIALESIYGRLKLAEEADYEQSQITRNIDLSTYNIEDGKFIDLSIRAEDGTEIDYGISIQKQANVELDSVLVNSNIIEYDEENGRYYELVSNGNKPQIVITPSNILQTVQLLNSSGTVLAQATGKLTTTQTLSTTDLTTNYVIKVISHNGEDYGTQEYELVIRQKSKELGISYVKVDSLGTIVSSDKLTYSTTVAGKETYPVEIKLKDEKAKVKIVDLEGKELISNQIGNLIGELAVADGETKQFNVIVTSENGEQKEYKLSIERVTSNLEIEEIQITDLDADGETIINRKIVNYDEDTKVYKIVVNKELKETEIGIKTVSEFTNILVDSSVTSKGTVTVAKELNGLGITQLTLDLTAADGNTDRRYIQLVQLSDEIRIETVEVDGIEVSANEAGEYETTLTDEVNLSNVKVTLLAETSKVSINKGIAELKESTTNVSKGNNRKIKVPIEVTAEDSTSYIYTLTLNIISHDTSLKSVIVENETATYIDGKYVVYFDRYATEIDVEIIAGVEYSSIKYQKDENTEMLEKEKLDIVLNTSDLEQEVYEITFKVIAEDGTEKEYIVQCIRKSDNNTIAGVYINDTKVEVNSENSDYADGTYYVAVSGNEANVKVEANNEFANINFAGKSAYKMLEKTITLDANKKVIEVPVTITSQQGSIHETIIYIEIISDNNNLSSVKVDSKLVEEAEENVYISYIYETVTSVNLEIQAENPLATVVRITENGEIYVEENGDKYEEKDTLSMTLKTEDQINTVYFKIVAENGLESDVYEIQISKMSTDSTLKEIYVNGELIEADAEGKYVTEVLDTVTNPVVKAVTNHKMAHVRILLGDENLNTSEETITMSEGRQTIVPITVRTQSGITKVTYLYINKISTSVALTSVTIDGRGEDRYIEETHTYRFLVDSELTDFELFAVAESNYSTIEYEEVEYEASLRANISVGKDAEGKTIEIKVKAESGTEQIYTIELVRESNDVELEYLKVNGEQLESDEENGRTYTVKIKKLATEATIEIKTRHSYANIRIADNVIVTGYDNKKIDCSNLEEERILVPIVVTAADGITVRTYNVILERASNNTNIVKVVVDNQELVADENENYEVRVAADLNNPNVDIHIITEDIKAKVRLKEIEHEGIFNEKIELDLTAKEIVLPIKVIAEDGTEKERLLTIKWLGRITGKVMTQISEEKPQKAFIIVYRTEDEGEELDREIIQQVETQEDGRFFVSVTPGEYDIVVTKQSYLEYRLTNIKLELGEEIVLDDINMYAGDINGDGKIEISDLTALTYNYGDVNEDSTLSIYDLNEDGIVNKEDRNILKGNYNKKNVTKIWGVEEEIEDGRFIFPLELAEGETYTITSSYGNRIHPTTGEESKHTGIDIVAEWHAKVYAVSSGEVVFAGNNGAFGNSVEIKHIKDGKEIYTFYAHLSKIDVDVGDKVSKGQVIGLEGGDMTDENPGNSTGHHLHFEVRTQSGYGNDVNPNGYIRFY